ncbi:hypothetical protein [Paraflavitalea speifideaquila]|uniref:hypothetical protein n=1 Tax=Paraflavitalea speifideaquila TaxID=3076558 RepID=UPI0028E7C61A|nr:hypothetical protein [Paraflavitalea speifideiaquila]
MGQEVKDQQDGWSGDDHISLHVLCEEDFPWLLLWMVKETNASLSLLLQTTKGSSEIVIITGIINEQPRISLLTVYASAFTRLKTAYVLQKNEFSIQQLQLNPLLFNKRALYSLLGTYITYLRSNKGASKILWEIHQKDKLYAKLAEKAGFRKSETQDQVQYTLYEFIAP